MPSVRLVVARQGRWTADAASMPETRKNTGIRSGSTRWLKVSRAVVTQVGPPRSTSVLDACMKTTSSTEDAFTRSIHSMRLFTCPAYPVRRPR